MALSLAEANPRSRRYGSLQSRPVAPPGLRGMDDQVARQENRREVRGPRRAGGVGAGARIVADSTLSRGPLNSTNDRRISANF